MKAGTGRRFLGGLLNDTSSCYTLEVSFYSYMLGGAAAAVPYTEEACILLRSILLQHLNQALKVNTSVSIRVCRDRNTHKWKCESAPDALISLILILHTVEIQEEKDIRSNKPFPSCRRLSHTLVREATPGESVIHSLPQPSISFFISLLIPSLALRFSYCFNSKWRVHLWC